MNKRYYIMHNLMVLIFICNQRSQLCTYNRHNQQCIYSRMCIYIRMCIYSRTCIYSMRFLYNQVSLKSTFILLNTRFISSLLSLVSCNPHSLLFTFNPLNQRSIKFLLNMTVGLQYSQRLTTLQYLKPEFT